MTYWNIDKAKYILKKTERNGIYNLTVANFIDSH